MLVKNITSGPKGIRNTLGAIVMLEANESQGIDIAKGEDAQTDWFEFAGSADGEPGPLDGSVEALTTHLETVSDADEVQRLIDAETAGKSRKGALAVLEARRDALLEA